MKRTILILMFLLSFCKISFGAISVDSFLSSDDVTIGHLEEFRTTVVNAINSADGGLIQTGTISSSKLDANTNPENRWNEAFNDFVYTGLLPATDSDLTSDISSGTAFIEGVRVVKDATSHTYTGIKNTYVDLSKTGTFTFGEVAQGAAAPAVAANSIRLAMVSSDSTTVAAVTDLRTTSITISTASSTVRDADNDTQIQAEESADEDIIRFDIAGTETAVFGDGTNEELVKLINAGTNHGFSIQQNGVLAAAKYGLYLYSNANQANSKLLGIIQDNASSASDVAEIQNDGTGKGLYINQVGVFATGKHGIHIYTNAVQNTADTSLLRITHDNASSNANCVPLYIQNDSTTADSIYEDSGAKLTVGGVWTDAPSTSSEKENIALLPLSTEYIQKLKNLNLYSYQKKREVYGAREETGEKDNNGKIKLDKKGRPIKEYPKIKKNPNARTYKGYILDDPSTPEELISRDFEGNINGVSPAEGVNFLLAVNKELLAKIEQLEARITALETP